MLDSLTSMDIPLEALRERPIAPIPDSRLEMFGENRASAGWQNPANFVITSAFVRLLGATEQIELDILKALFYYRPSGRIEGRSNETIRVDADIILEIPVKELDKWVYQRPVIWTWIKKFAENNIERDKIFSNVFGIKTLPPECDAKRKVEWYDKRNAIAHGRSNVIMKLGEFIDVLAYFVQSLRFLAEQCRQKLDVQI
jgi:hypothetical protein